MSRLNCQIIFLKCKKVYKKHHHSAVENEKITKALGLIDERIEKLLNNQLAYMSRDSESR